MDSLLSAGTASSTCAVFPKCLWKITQGQAQGDWYRCVGKMTMTGRGLVLEKLIHDHEFENQQYIRVIAHDEQLIKNLSEEIKNKHLEYQKLQESIAQINEDTKMHHKQFIRNRDNNDSLKKTNQVLTDHVAAVTQKLNIKQGKHHEERKKIEETLQQHKEKWNKYERIYEQMPETKELRHWEKKLTTLEAAYSQNQARLAEMKRQIHHLENKSPYDEMTLNEFIVQIAEMYVSTKKLACEMEKKKAEQAASILERDEREGRMDSNTQQVSEMQRENGEGETMQFEGEAGDNLNENTNQLKANEEMQTEDESANQSYHEDSQMSMAENQIQRPPFAPETVPALSRQFQATGLQQIPVMQTVYDKARVGAPLSMVKPSMPSQPPSMARSIIPPQGKVFTCRPSMGMPSNMQTTIRPGLPPQSMVRSGQPLQTMVRPGLPQQSLIRPSLPPQTMVRPGLPQQFLVRPGIPQQSLVRPSLPPQTMAQPVIPQQMQQQRQYQPGDIQKRPAVQPSPSLGNRYASIQKPNFPTVSERSVTSQPTSMSYRQPSVQVSNAPSSLPNRSTPQKQQQSMHNLYSTAPGSSIHTASNNQMTGAVPRSVVPGVTSGMLPGVPRSDTVPGRNTVGQPFMVNRQFPRDRTEQNRTLQNPLASSVTSQGNSTLGVGVPMVRSQFKATTNSHPTVKPQVRASFNPRQMQPAVSTKSRVEKVIPASPQQSQSFIPRRSLPGLMANNLAQRSFTATIPSSPVPKLPISTVLSSVSTPNLSVTVPNASGIPTTLQPKNPNALCSTLPSPSKTLQAQNFAISKPGIPQQMQQQRQYQKPHQLLHQQQLYKKHQHPEQQQPAVKQQQQVPPSQQGQLTPQKNAPVQQQPGQQPERPHKSIGSKMPSPVGSVLNTPTSKSTPASITTRPAKGMGSFPATVSEASPVVATQEGYSLGANETDQASREMLVPPSPKIMRTSYSDLGETYEMPMKPSPSPIRKHLDRPTMSSQDADVPCSPVNNVGDGGKPNTSGKLDGEDCSQDSPFTMEKHHQRLAKLKESPGYHKMYSAERRMFERQGKSNDSENGMDTRPLEMQTFGQTSEDLTCVMFGGGGDLTNQQAAKKDAHDEGRNKSTFMFSFNTDSPARQGGPLGSGHSTNTKASGMFGWNTDQQDSPGIQSLFGQSNGNDEPAADNSGFFLNFGTGSTNTSPPKAAADDTGFFLNFGSGSTDTSPPKSALSLF